MKKLILTSLGIVSLLFISNTFCQSQSEIDYSAKRAAALKNPLAGVCCPDESIRLDCVCKLSKLNNDKALFALMKILREDPSDAVKIAAAQSLVKMGDPRGVFLVARHAKFSDSPKVSKFCEKFAQAFHYQEYLVKMGINQEEEQAFALTAME